MFKRFFKFFLTNISGTVIDTISLWLLKTYVFSSYVGTYVISPIIGFELAMLNNFIISYFWIWHKRVHYHSKDFFKKLLKYNISVSVTFGVRMMIIIGVERLFHFDVIICNFIALALSGLLNFLLGEKWVFMMKGKNKIQSEKNKNPSPKE